MKERQDISKRLILLLAIIAFLLTVGRVYARSIKPKQISTDPEIIYKEITYKPADITPKGSFPIGNKEPIKPKVVQVATPVIKTQPRPVYVAQVTNNEQAVWDFLIKRYTRNQTAGIMGNLKQEHGFQTSGDGLAQWNGGRKARLMAMPNPYSLDTQLNFLETELNESGLVLPDDVVGATRTFQNSFERCGMCNEIARINYAYAILARH